MNGNLNSKGYPKLAAWMAKHPEIAIFRKFGDLQLRSLLFMQAQIVSLEEDLEILAEEDRKADPQTSPERARYDCDYQALANSMEDEESTDGLQKLKMLEICSVLKEYCPWHTIQTQIIWSQPPDTC